MDHLVIKSTTAVAGKAGFTLASAATAVVGQMVEFVSSNGIDSAKIEWMLEKLHNF